MENLDDRWTDLGEMRERLGCQWFRLDVEAERLEGGECLGRGSIGEERDPSHDQPSVTGSQAIHWG